MNITGQLIGPEGSKLSFADCRVEALFDRIVEASSSGTTPAGATSDLRPATATQALAVSVSPTDGGAFTFEITEVEAIVAKRIELVVYSPAGKRIGGMELQVADGDLALEVPVDSFGRADLVSPEDARRRVQGRVIELNGKELPARFQVLILARDLNNNATAGQPANRDVPNADAGEEAAGAENHTKSVVTYPGTPVLVATVDRSGYFAGEVPPTKFESAIAVVEGFADSYPISLDSSLIPTTIPIVVEIASKQLAPGDCDCGSESTRDLSGRCVSVNQPNKAIEEFNFYTVVRTTEPEILAREIGKIIDPPVDSGVRPEIPGPTISVSVEILNEAIRSAVLAYVNSGRTPSWEGVEAVIRAAIAGAGGRPLPQNFFENFTGWARGGLTQPPEYWAMVMRLAAAFSERNAGAPASNQTPAREAAFVARFIDPGTVRTDWALRPAESGRVQPNWSDLLRGSQERVPQRMPLSRQNRVDWDSTPTFYEATSIAHGHLLHFKQTWFADGYSLGDLLYSLPLAPGQKKVISVIDWERREQSSRDELTSLEEGVQAQLSRDRDLGEVISGTLSEYSRGESSNSTKGFGIGKGSAGNGSYGGFSFGGVMGVSGGFGDSTSGAFLEGNREVSSSSLQTLRDRTVQSAAAVRSLRSTVVQTARQGETVRATTEVVANHNHCHTLTIQYFEVLRHMRAEHALEDVQECLFVPLPMMDFHREMVVRWRQPLEAYLQRPELAAGFDALRRVDTNWTEVDYPQARYADEHVTAIFGEMTLTILIPLPPFPEKPTPDPRQTVAELEAKTRQALLPTEGFLGSVLTVFSFGANHVTNAVADAAVKASTAGARALTDSLFAEVSPEERYARFHQDIMPGVAAGFVDKLELYAIVNDASTSMSKEVKLNGSDFTLVSGYEPGTPLLISVRGGITTPVRRSEISALVIKSSAPLPEGCRAIINSATLQYQTNLFRHGMVMDSRVNDDIDFPTVAYTGDPPATFQLPALFPAAWPQVPGMTPIRSGNGATLYTPLDEWEQRWPRREDSRLSAELIVHLNTNIEYYHHAIWWTMDPNRRYMLLDGFVAPGSNGRSVASVVDNKLIGIIGNSLILPVARGFHLDPQFSTKDNQTLLAHYKPQSPVPAANVALPTRGVFAEASVGECNACEEIDDTRFWRWEESPIDEPPVLDMSALLSRRAEPTNLTPTPLPAPIVSIQNAPAAPDPVGIEAALGALTTQSFADITGLAGTQANAAAAYAKAMDTALAFGKEASVLAQQANMNRNIGQTMRAIDKAESENKIDSGNATQLRNTALKSLVGDTPTDATAASIADRLQVIDGAQERGGIDDATAQAFRSDVLSGLIPDGATLADQSEAVTDVLGQIPPENFRTLKFGDLELETVQLLGEKDAWPNLDSAQVRTRLKELLDSKGDKFDQGTLGLCSAAAFFHHVIQARPLEFYLFADALYRDGFARLGQLYVAPGRDVRNADFKALKKKFGAMPPQADWMLMSALRDSENWLLDFQGGENEDEAMETTAEELAGWYRKTGFYSKVIYSTERTPAAIDALERNNPSNQIALAVWAKLIPGYEQSTSGHAITVEGDLKVDIPNNRIEFDYWTWGKSEYRHTSRFLSNFASNFYLGAIVATRKPMGPRPDQQL